ncbi:MAG: type II toxin-antitoxin system prevent-host-death family antitoxin [Ignavibacteria bacterium]|nr:type II toxin-antitoxin system prevent-host-death family antitoxin [Ignavibacteria bacterium]
MEQISIYELEKNIARIIQSASEGEELIVVKDGKPIVKITSISSRPKAKFGSAKEKIKFIAEDFDETPKEFENEYMP